MRRCKHFSMSRRHRRSIYILSRDGRSNARSKRIFEKGDRLGDARVVPGRSSRRHNVMAWRRRSWESIYVGTRDSHFSVSMGRLTPRSTSEHSSPPFDRRIDVKFHDVQAIELSTARGLATIRGIAGINKMTNNQYERDHRVAVEWKLAHRTSGIESRHDYVHLVARPHVGAKRPLGCAKADR